MTSGASTTCRLWDEAFVASISGAPHRARTSSLSILTSFTPFRQTRLSTMLYGCSSTWLPPHQPGSGERVGGPSNPRLQRTRAARSPLSRKPLDAVE